jgi:hypothetical protein
MADILTFGLSARKCPFFRSGHRTVQKVIDSVPSIIDLKLLAVILIELT